MNPLPPNADELVSAYLDGQASPDEVVIVESSPKLMDRVASMRGVADLVSEPAAHPAAQKDAHISAALDAFDALFAQDVDQVPLAGPSVLAGVPTSAVHHAAEHDTTSPALDASTISGVTSLATAREQRHPRRFNTGIIAAAAAVVLLFVAVAAFGLGGGEDSFDVASTQSEAANTVADAPEIESFTDGTSEGEAMTADRPDVGALEAAPAPTSAPPQAAASQPAEEEEMAADAASDDGGGLDSETGTALATESLALTPLPLFVGDFLDQEALLRALEQVPVDELAKRVEPFEPGFFPSCQQDVPELAATETPTYVGGAFIAGTAVEVHRIGEGDDIVIVLVDPTDCSVLPATP
ncbi:MAG: hypothetical protein KC481_02815 [Acidimicrobiaceae bacterium]|nr:hypothetical protein [Acidimicrobiaceae bacterium]MCO4832564.1 hypothetical protein [Acidimicrobiaceae bacterium]MDC1389918.1 hypothetical protein [Acidimicrobiales bacterium]